MNDNKYGRLYPERAVAPARKALRSARKFCGGDAGNPSIIREIDAALIDLEGLGFPEDEPLFLLRGQDALAGDVVRFYTDSVRRYIAFGGVTENGAVIAHLEAHADRMDLWQPRKLPD